MAVTVGMPVVTLFLGALINHLIDKRSKLIAHLGFISSHSLKPQADGKPGAVVNTHSVVIKNPRINKGQVIKVDTFCYFGLRPREQNVGATYPT